MASNNRAATAEKPSSTRSHCHFRPSRRTRRKHTSQQEPEQLCPSKLQAGRLQKQTRKSEHTKHRVIPTPGKTDGRTDGQTDTRTNAQTDGQTDRRTGEPTDNRTHGRTDGHTDGQTDRQTDEKQTDGQTNRSAERCPEVPTVSE